MKTKADDEIVVAEFAAAKKHVDVYSKGAAAELAEVRPLRPSHDCAWSCRRWGRAWQNMDVPVAAGLPLGL